MFKQNVMSAILVALIAVQSMLAAEPATPKSEEQSFENKDLHLRFIYPADWTIKRQDTSDPDFPLVLNLVIGEGANMRGGAYVIAAVSSSRSGKARMRDP